VLAAHCSSLCSHCAVHNLQIQFQFCKRALTSLDKSSPPPQTPAIIDALGILNLWSHYDSQLSQRLSSDAVRSVRERHDAAPDQLEADCAHLQTTSGQKHSRTGVRARLLFVSWICWALKSLCESVFVLCGCLRMTIFKGLYFGRCTSDSAERASLTFLFSLCCIFCSVSIPVQLATV
jgi:hypothetical protein